MAGIDLNLLKQGTWVRHDGTDFKTLANYKDILADGRFSIGRNSDPQASGGVALGNTAIVSDNAPDGISIGSFSFVRGATGPIGIGRNVLARGSGAAPGIAIGSFAAVADGHSGSVIVGNSAFSTGASACGFGEFVQVAAGGSSFGRLTKATGSESGYFGSAGSSLASRAFTLGVSGNNNAVRCCLVSLGSTGAHTDVGTHDDSFIYGNLQSADEQANRRYNFWIKGRAHCRWMQIRADATTTSYDSHKFQLQSSVWTGVQHIDTTYEQQHVVTLAGVVGYKSKVAYKIDTDTLQELHSKNSIADNETVVFLLCKKGAAAPTLEKVSLGAVDTMGVGFRGLKIPN